MPDMAPVAQLAEHLIVVQVVVGSNPTGRPAKSRTDHRVAFGVSLRRTSTYV